MLDRVLVVDDSHAIRAFVRASLESSGQARTVLEASSGFEAMRLLPRERFELAIIDINMPDIHGLEVIKLIRTSKVHHGVPMIAISSEGSGKDRERALALGADAWLDKPFTSELLAETIARVLAAGVAVVGGSAP